MPLGTLLNPCAWQSTCEPEQLHLCGHARAAARHSKPHSRANEEPRWNSGRLSRAAGAIVPATRKRKKTGREIVDVNKYKYDLKTKISGACSKVGQDPLTKIITKTK